ncbi:MAG: MBL fold metallo-hydrolase, partial [Roseovarius sp.]|nr:MBL fold metallo-hydrolase [Roseovarius sp.]
MFLEEAVPDRMKGLKVADGVTRFVANNPGKMTYHGTNTYMVEMSEGSVIIDPGPAEDAAHLQMILHNLPDNAAGILVTHHHSDHFGAAPVLREA